MPTEPNNPPDIDRILTTFLQLDSDPLALAEHLGVTPFELLDFFERPDVSKRLEQLEALIARGERLRESKARAAALAALERIVEDEETDPTERRRAAATILRAISRPRARKQNPPPTDPPDSRSDPNATADRASRPTRNGSTGPRQTPRSAPTASTSAPTEPTPDRDEPQTTAADPGITGPTAAQAPATKAGAPPATRNSNQPTPHRTPPARDSQISKVPRTPHAPAPPKASAA